MTAERPSAETPEPSQGSHAPGGPGGLRRWSLPLSRALALSTAVLAPLPFGSVETIWIATWCAIMAVSLMLAEIPELSGRQIRILFAVLGVYACLLIVVALQIVGAQPDPLWQRAEILLGTAPGTPSAGIRAAALPEIGASLLFVLVFCRFFLLGATGYGEQVFRVVAWSGLCYAIFGAATFVLDPGHILGRAKTAYLDSLTGTFVNRNTAAAYFGAITSLWLIMLLSALRRGRDRKLSASEQLWLVLSGREAHLIGLFFGVLLCLGATAATGSRAGFILSVAACAAIALLYGRGLARLLRRRWWWVAGGLLVAFLTLELLAGRVTTRLHLIGFDDEARWEVYLASLRLVLEQPWIGHGLGRFEEIFAAVRPPAAGVSGVWNRAHSTPLEIAVELGVPLTALIATLWLWLLGKLLRIRSPLSVAGLGIGLLGTLHSTIDFSLQIPGFAVIFAAITAVGLAKAVAPGSHRSDHITPLGKERNASRRTTRRRADTARPKSSHEFSAGKDMNWSRSR